MRVGHFADPGYKNVPNLADVAYRAGWIGEAQVSYGGPGGDPAGRAAGVAQWGAGPGRSSNGTQP